MKLFNKSTFLIVAIIATVLSLLSYTVLFAHETEKTSGTAILKTTMVDENIVVLDAGHGGYDTGSDRNGYYEKDITLDYVLKLGKALQKRGIKVVYTRENDDWYWTEDNIEDLDYRVAISNEVMADLFVSIHLNDSDYEASGIETWVSFSDEASYQLASDIQTALVSVGYAEDRFVRDHDEVGLRVLTNNQASSCLVELGFMTDENDLEAILNPTTADLIVAAMADAIAMQFK